DGPTSIWAIGVETGERRRLTAFTGRFAKAIGSLGDNCPSISPDGRTLAFFRQSVPLVHELFSLTLAHDLKPSGEPARITDRQSAFVGGTGWTVDSTEIVYSTGGSDILSLWRIPRSGKREPARLSYASASALSPTIARTGSRLAYSFWRYDVDIWRLDTRTGERVRLIGSSYVNSFPRYSPDGSRIAFVSNQSGTQEIWTCDGNGANCMRVTSFNGPVVGTPTWSPDGSQIALDCARGRHQIYVVPADGGTPPRNISNSLSADASPSWSRDGWIYFSSDRSGRYELWKVPSDDGTPVQVTHLGGGKA